MVKENLTFYSDNQVNVDTENLQLKNCIVFSTSINKSQEYEFSEKNLQEVVDLGNAGDVNAYLDHARGVLEKRVAEWIPGSFRIDGSFVRADMQLKATNDVNPEVSNKYNVSYNEFIMKLAQTEPDKCGFSCVFLLGLVDGDVSIKSIMSIDLVEVPNLTPAMFSYNDEVKMSEVSVEVEVCPEEKAVEISEKLIAAYELFAALDIALRDAQPIDELKAKLIEELSNVSTTSPEPEVMVENAVVEGPSEIEMLKEMIVSLSKKVDELSLVKSENSQKEEKVVQFSVNSVTDDEVPSVDHMSVYSRLMSEGKSAQAARYHKLNLSKG